MIEPNDVIIIDARSPAHFTYAMALIESCMCEDRCVLVFSNKLLDVRKMHPAIQRPEMKIEFDFDISDHGLFLKYGNLRKIRSQIRRILNSRGGRKIKLLTSYNYGLFFEVLKSTLALDWTNIIVLDDGIGNRINIKNRRVTKALYYGLHGVLGLPSGSRLYEDARCMHIATIFGEHARIRPVGNAAVLNMTDHVKKYHSKILSAKNWEPLKPNSALLLTHHAVESRRMTVEKFQSLIARIVLSIRDRGYDNIYLTRHHREGAINKSFYDSLGVNLVTTGAPAELLVASGHISLIANPYNSSVPVLYALGYLKNINCVINYEIPKSPYIAERKCEVMKILKSLCIESAEVDVVA